MTRWVRAVLITLVALVPTQAYAWGYDAHRLIMDHAIPLLPPELRPLFEANRTMVVERAIDPDLWRDAGFGQESKNHFIDIDWEGYGPAPFAALPRDYERAVVMFGRSRIEENGVLPWRVEEMYGKLREAFESYRRRGPFGRLAILHTAAWLAHYVSDAHQPFHSVVNYDGQLTGQNGVHTRFESLLFERFQNRLQVAPRRMPPISRPKDFVFDRVIEGAALVPGILQNDREAIGADEVYGDRYFRAFFESSQPVLERRLNESIAAVAAMIAGAWEAAGRPPAPVSPPNVPLRRRPS